MTKQCYLLLLFISLPMTHHAGVARIPLPTGFINIDTVIDRNIAVTYLLDETESTQFVAQIPNGIVIDNGGIITDDGLILRDTETYRDDQHRLLNGKRDIRDEKSIFFDGKLAVIASPGQENWYHWLLQALPRLKILAESGITYDKIYVGCIPYAWQQESLRMVLEKLNIPSSAILTTQENLIIQAKELIVPSVPFIPSKNRRTFPYWMTTFIHDCFLPHDACEAPQKIYISRSNASIRRVSNETELTNILKDRGFTIVHLENMPIAEQARYFNQASIIIGPHGSGFANLIFSIPHTTIIEIDHGLMGKDQRSFYKRMSHLMNCKYHAFYTDQTTEDHLEEDLLVDINAFNNLLDTVDF